MDIPFAEDVNYWRTRDAFLRTTDCQLSMTIMKTRNILEERLHLNAQDATFGKDIESMITSIDFRRWLNGNDITGLLFYPLYIAVSAATFRHSAAGFASIEGGSVWWAALSALAVDVGMILSASGLRQRRNLWLILGLVISAAASTYTQLLFSVTNAASIPVAPGAEWLDLSAATLINVRILILPALLPVLAVVYAFSAKTMGKINATSDELTAVIAEINASTPKLTDRARQIWELSENGHGSFTVAQVADFAQCSERTAQLAKPK